MKLSPLTLLGYSNTQNHNISISMCSNSPQSLNRTQYKSWSSLDVLCHLVSNNIFMLIFDPKSDSLGIYISFLSNRTVYLTRVTGFNTTYC